MYNYARTSLDGGIPVLGPPHMIFILYSYIHLNIITWKKLTVCIPTCFYIAKYHLLQYIQIENTKYIEDFLQKYDKKKYVGVLLLNCLMQVVAYLIVFPIFYISISYLWVTKINNSVASHKYFEKNCTMIFFRFSTNLCMVPKENVSFGAHCTGFTHTCPCTMITYI